MEKWRFKTQAVRYNPEKKLGDLKPSPDWLGFFQIGEIVDNQIFTLEKYLAIEDKYITAVLLFFRYHNSKSFILRRIEISDFNLTEMKDKEDLCLIYNDIKNGKRTFQLGDVPNVIKLILREVIWAECFDSTNSKIAVRFGYDFYMYFNSSKKIDDFCSQIKDLGLSCL